MSEKAREALPDVREWSEGSRGFAGVVGRLYRMFESSQEALPDVWECSGGPPGSPGVVGTPSLKC